MSNFTAPFVDAPVNREEWSLLGNFSSIIFSLIFPFVSLVVMSFPQKFDRWVAVTMVLTSAYTAFITSDNLSPDDTLNEVYTRYIIIGGSYMLSIAYKLDKTIKVQHYLDYKTARPTWSPWYKGYKLMWNIRGVGTSWENPYLWPGVKHTWDVSKAPDSNRGQNSTYGSRNNLMIRGKFSGIAIRLLYVVPNFVLLACLYEFFDPQYLLDAGPADMAPEKESIVRRALQTWSGSQMITPVTSRELIVRAISAIENTAGNFLTFSLYHDVCAIFFIIIGLDESWEWPPFFGQITEAYTMRRWWSMWWHRSIYRSFNSHSEVLLGFIRLKKGSALYRTLTAFIVFGLSAIMHALVSWKYGNSCAWGRSMIYWILHPIAFILEGLVQALWHEVKRRLGVTKSRLLDIFERVVGYIWVCSFLVWIVPKYNWPLRSCVS